MFISGGEGGGGVAGGRGAGGGAGGAERGFTAVASCLLILV